MERPEIIFALAKYAHPTWYGSLVDWSTEQLQDLLNFYQTEGNPEKKKFVYGMIHKMKGLGECAPCGANAKRKIVEDMAEGIYLVDDVII